MKGQNMRETKFTKEFKDSAVQLAMNSEASVKTIASDLDIHYKTLYGWIANYRKANNIKLDGRRNTQRSSTSKETLDEENRRLRAENKLLKQERDILKKATAYFAKDTL